MTAEARQRLAGVARWLFPSIKDILFLAFLFIPLMTKESGVLYDGDTGWHIRNGEHIIKSRQFPRTDYFSYTREGTPWFAWEWLADVVMAVIHRHAGLNGIVVWANLLFASTFTLLFHWMLRSGGNIFLCLVFTVLAGFASAVHWLARPHLFTMLLVLVWAILLEKIQKQGSSAQLKANSLAWVLPPVILVWCNLHGGFVVGLILLMIYGIANFLTWLTASDAELGKRAQHLAWRFLKLTALCLLITLLNPYGIGLHRHIFDSYFFSQYLVDRITEFASPDFHTPVVRFFELILLSSLVVAGTAFRRLSFLDIGFLLFWTHMALFSVRHVPLYTLMVAPLIVRHASDYLRQVASGLVVQRWVGDLAKRFGAYSEQIRQFEAQFKGFVYPPVATLLLVFICLKHGELAGSKVLQAGFDEKRFPLKAAAFVDKMRLSGNLFTTDYWGGYMIYRFHPQHKVFFDGRSDMYGREFLKEYESLVNLDYSWQTVLNKYDVAWVLLPVEFGLATALKERGEWEVLYDDHQAIIFQRKNPKKLKIIDCQGMSSCLSHELP
jgi:hypothetical protein